MATARFVERDRRGRNVLVRRTVRGEALLELYDELERGIGMSDLRRAGRSTRTLRGAAASLH